MQIALHLTHSEVEKTGMKLSLNTQVDLVLKGRLSTQNYTMTAAEFSRAHWLIPIVNRLTDRAFITFALRQRARAGKLTV